ncbi:hypothetical protein NSA18_02725 [Pasteurella caecimuris]|nr:hypothetical protein [Pasteurella caecimuris]MCR1836827.1 hypothetical protein [Pasteurella caecimuris]MCU0105958.1 hypothetical protein [Pasteurella caecimuris]
MLEYLENQAKQSIAEIQKSNEQNREKAYRLLNYLVAGIGGVAYPEFADDILAVQFRDLRAKAGTDTFLSSNTESAQKQLGHASPQMTKRYIRKDKIVQPTKS